MKILKYLLAFNTTCWILCLAILLKPYTSSHFESVNPILRPYVSDYYKLVETNCDPMQYNSTGFYDIDFITLPKESRINAYCELRWNGYSIAINMTHWKDFIEPDKRQLLYHELAHCLLWKKHVNDKNNYMNPVFYPLLYEDYLPQVMKDIKVRCQNK